MRQLEPLTFPALVLLTKATCLLLVALGASVLLRRASAGSRHLVWLVAVVGVLAMPAVAAWGPLKLRVLPAEAVSRAKDWPLRGGYPQPFGSSQSNSMAEAPSALRPSTGVTSTPSSAKDAAEPSA